jgi:hypothetical protein
MATITSVQPNWPLARKKLKETYGILNDEDLQYEQGQENDLRDRLASRLQLNPVQVQRLLESFGLTAPQSH